MNAFLLAPLFFVWGACLGSFATAMVYRIPRGLSWIYEPSHDDNSKHSICPSCKHILHMRDLVPLLSYIFTRGHCRYCKTYVSKRYPLTELLCAILACVIYFIIPSLSEAIFTMFYIPFAISFLMITLFHQRISKQLIGIICVLIALHIFIFHSPFVNV